MLERELVGQLDGLDGSATKAQNTPATTPPFGEMIVADRDGDTTLLEQGHGIIGSLPFVRSDEKSPDLTDGLSDFGDLCDLSPHFSNVDPMAAACTDWQAAGGIIMSNLGTTTPVKQYEAIPTFLSDNLCLPPLVRADLYVHRLSHACRRCR